MKSKSFVESLEEILAEIEVDYDGCIFRLCTKEAKQAIIDLVRELVPEEMKSKVMSDIGYSAEYNEKVTFGFNACRQAILDKLEEGR